MASYVCPSCGVDFGYPQGLSVHKELGCDWGDEPSSISTPGQPSYCCGVMYDEGETACRSCGDPL